MVKRQLRDPLQTPQQTNLLDCFLTSPTDRTGRHGFREYTLSLPLVSPIILSTGPTKKFMGRVYGFQQFGIPYGEHGGILFLDSSFQSACERGVCGETER